MDRLISCEFNMDTACVELKFANGSMIAIDTIAVENEVADNMYQRSETGLADLQQADWNTHSWYSAVIWSSMHKECQNIG